MSDRHWLLSEERCASLTCNCSIRTSFLRLLVGLFRQLNMSKKTCFAISASCLWNVLLALGRMPLTTRRIGTISPLTCDFIPFVNRFAILFVRWFSLSVFGCLWIWSKRGRPLFLFKKFAPVTRSSNSMMETTRVSFRTLSSCLPLPAISHFPFNVGFIFLSTPCHYSMNHIVSGFKVPTSHLLVKKQSHWCFLILSNLFVFCFAPFLDHTEPTQSVTEQNPLMLTSTILPGTYPKVVHLLIIVPDTIGHRKSWTSSFWRRLVNKCESPCTDS